MTLEDKAKTMEDAMDCLCKREPNDIILSDPQTSD